MAGSSLTLFVQLPSRVCRSVVDSASPYSAVGRRWTMLKQLYPCQLNGYQTSLTYRTTNGKGGYPRICRHGKRIEHFTQHTVPCSHISNAECFPMAENWAVVILPFRFSNFDDDSYDRGQHDTTS